MADVALRPTAASNASEHVLSNSPLDQSDAIASLLSLSFAEGGSAPAKRPTAIATVSVKNEPPAQQSVPTVPPGHAPSTSVPLASSLNGGGGKHHRRLSSTGKTRRRLSDAREAANRPSPSLVPSTSAALSLATLSLSSSPPSSYPAQISASFTGASRTLAPAPPKGANATISNVHSGPIPITTCDDEKNGAIPIPISSSGRTGKKRGMDHRCESCSKIYRHPSCLIKHRWEHTPHWREASKFVLSKHQQVQLLEAAAILSHMSPAASGGRSLPEDRSLWPSFLSGGSLPPPEQPISANRSASGSDSTTAYAAVPNGSTAATAPLPSYMPHVVSSSVPARSTSIGPRLHDYGVGPGVVTRLRPGLIGVTTSSGGVASICERGSASGCSKDGLESVGTTQPVPVPNGNMGGRHYHDAFGSLGSTGSPSYYRSQHQHAAPAAESWGSHGYGSAGQHGLVGYPYSNGVASLKNETSVSGGWSLPGSSVRGHIYQYSRSRSRSLSNDEDMAASSRRIVIGNSESPPSDDESIDVDGLMDGDRDRGREVDIVIEEEEDDDEPDGVIAADCLGKGAPIDDGKTGMHTPRTVYEGGRYPHLLVRNGYQPTSRRLHGLDDDEDMGRNFSLREEDEEMDDIIVGRVKKGGSGRREEEWDGMEMEIDMDMD